MSLPTKLFFLCNCLPIQLPASSPATVPTQHFRWRLFEGAWEAVTCDTSCLQAFEFRDKHY
eukprot:7328300-Pyramimonas_sp.AAC.1